MKVLVLEDTPSAQEKWVRYFEDCSLVEKVDITDDHREFLNICNKFELVIIDGYIKDHETGVDIHTVSSGVVSTAAGYFKGKMIFASNMPISRRNAKLFDMVLDGKSYKGSPEELLKKLGLPKKKRVRPPGPNGAKTYGFKTTSYLLVSAFNISHYFISTISLAIQPLALASSTNLGTALPLFTWSSLLKIKVTPFLTRFCFEPESD